MTDGGISWSLYEIIEIMLVTLILLLIGGSILIVPKANFIQTKLIAYELGYTSSLISDTDLELKVNYPDISNVKSEQNTIIVTYPQTTLKSEASANKKYFGSSVYVEKSASNQFCITGKTSCQVP